MHFAARRGPSNQMNKPHADFEVENHGTIFLIRPTSEAGSDHFAEPDPWHYTFFGQSRAVEHRFIEEVLDRLCESFTVTATT